LNWGFFLAHAKFGGRRQKEKRALILDSERFRYQKFCSDIAGQDIKSHEGSAQKVIRAVRNWLATALDGSVLLPSAAKVAAR
jgi:hypothetical protein